MKKKEDTFGLQNRFLCSYKKNTIAIFLSFVLTITLITALLILVHTNFKLQNIQWQMLNTPSDCEVKDIDRQQMERLCKREDLSWFALQQEGNEEYSIGSQFIILHRGDDSFITLTGRLEQGEMPKKENEVVAERWALLNMGIEPKKGTEFKIKSMRNGKDEHFRLVGILSDMPGNKKYGLKCLYTKLNKSASRYSVYLRFKDGTDYKKATKDIMAKLHIKKEQIDKCPARVDQKKLAKMDLELMSILILICMIAFYGIYHIGMTSRKKQYGILHAIGMKKMQIQKVILLELYEIFGVSIPVGLGAGYLIAALVGHLSGDSSQKIYLNNKQFHFNNVFPIAPIAICIIVLAVIMGVIGVVESRKIANTSVIALLSSSEKNKDHKSRYFFLQADYSKRITQVLMGIKYILRDKKSSLLVVLTVCIGITLFTGLAYEQRIAATKREDTKEMDYLNGQYEMGTMWVSSTLQGLPRENVKEISSINGVTNVKTQAGIPIRVVDDKKVHRNEAYYRKENEKSIKAEKIPLMGNDGTDEVYKTILYGYNKNALKELKKYVIEGNLKEDKLKEDEVIVSVESMDQAKSSKNPGYYKDGSLLMDYHTGDKIKVKYRKDFKTDLESYNTLKDKDAKYCYKTYTVKAVVSFPYMFDSNFTVFPLMITKDENIQKICTGSNIQRVYLDCSDSFSVRQQEELEQRLITMGNKSENISTRSMILDIQNNEMLYQKQMVYIIGIAIVAFILVLINMMTNLKFRMYVRTKEICMYRAIGMSISMIRKIVLFENVMMFTMGSVLSFALLQPILKIMYKQLSMKAYGHIFSFDYTAFGSMVAAAMLLCIILSVTVTKTWKTKKIMEQINNVD